MGIGGPIAWRLIVNDLRSLPFELDDIIFTSFCFFFAIVGTILLWSLFTKFNYNFILAIILIVLYCALFISSIIIELVGD